MERKKLKILILTDWYLPAIKAGGPVRSISNLVEHLGSDYSFYIFTSNKESDGTSLDIATDIWTIHNNCQVNYQKVNPFVAFSFIKALRTLKPDIVYINSVFSFWFSILPLFLRKTGITGSGFKWILAPRGMLQKGAIEIKKIKKTTALSILRRLGFYKGIYIHATDKVEAIDVHFFLKIPLENILVLPNIPSFITTIPTPTKKVNQLKLIFLSRITPKKNLKLVLDALHNLPEQFQIEFTIIGPFDKGMEEIFFKHLKELPANIQWHVENEISQELVFEKLSKNQVYILPTRGENFGHSIYEALLAGLPVIISDQTPWRNLKQAHVGFDLSLENPDDFEKAIAFFAVMDEADYRNWSNHATAYAREYFNAQQFETAYQQLFDKKELVGLVAPMPDGRFKGGITVFARQLLQAEPNWKKAGYPLIFINTCQLKRGNNSTGRFTPVNLLNYLLFLYRAIIKVKSNKISTLHLHTSVRLSLLKECVTATFFKFLFGTRNILHIHWADKDTLFYSRGLTKLNLKLMKYGADKIVVLSNAMRNFLANKGIPAEKISVIYNFTNTSAEETKNDLNHELQLLYLGAVTREKGFDDLVNALAPITKLNWQLHVAGDFISNEYKHMIEEKLEKLPELEKKINWLGYLEEEQKTNTLSRMDVMILPSYGEGMPLSILEGIEFGHAILTTDVGAIREYFEHAAVIVTPGNIGEMTDEITKLATNEQYLNKRKEESRKLAGKYSFDRYSENILQVYQDLSN